ncbi:UDP-2,3-diacylglucosamine diphosphatase [Halocola ammonii]
MKRKIEILLLSDLHLGSFGCRARELNRYLRSIDPEMVILNGDIIDMWQFKKRYWPDHHMRVIKQLIKIASKVPVYYITGNHDEALRKYSDFHLGNLKLVDKLELEIDGDRYWIFHGDIFDTAMKNARWLAKLGAIGYDTLIWTNTVVNWILESLGRERMSFSKRIKNRVKKAVSYISDFEETAGTIAIENHYDYVVCGHIHQPAMKTIHTKRGSVKYLNSGDWIENLTALEYKNGSWSMYHYDAAQFAEQEMKEKLIVHLNRKSA